MGRSLPGGGGCGHCFVAVGRCACEGGQEPFCGSAGVMCVGVLGSCMHIRRSRPIECAAVVSKLFSLLDSTAGDHADQWTTPAFACVYRNSAHEQDCVCTVHRTSPNAIARIGAATKSPSPAVDIPFGLTAGCTSIKHRLYPACFVATTPALHPPAIRVIPPCIRRSIVIRNTVSYELIALA